MSVLQTQLTGCQLDCMRFWHQSSTTWFKLISED